MLQFCYYNKYYSTHAEFYGESSTAYKINYRFGTEDTNKYQTRCIMDMVDFCILLHHDMLLCHRYIIVYHDYITIGHNQSCRGPVARGG